MIPACPKVRRGIFSRPIRAFALVGAALVAPFATQACFSGARQEPDTISGTRSELIAAAGGFI